jgi:hypothetical protein
MIQIGLQPLSADVADPSPQAEQDVGDHPGPESRPDCYPLFDTRDGPCSCHRPHCRSQGFVRASNCWQPAQEPGGGTFGLLWPAEPQEL